MLANHVHAYLLEKLKSNDILNYLEIGVENLYGQMRSLLK
jgi:hypothetical protein